MTEAVELVLTTEYPGRAESLNDTLGNETMTAFIFSVYAFSISGAFVWAALFVTCFQIFHHLRYYSVPEQQLWIVRILFIVPIYGFCSWLGLIFHAYSVYFDAVRSCYEAFVIYNFLRLCLAYLGGETAILAHINGKPIERSFWAGTCCFPKISYSVRFLRFCKQATLQFCIVKPIVATVTIILEACGVYKEGSMDPKHGYLYCTLAYNISVSLALYGLVLFYSATRDQLSKFYPVLKFFAIKSIVFLSFWQGVLLTIFHWSGLLKDSQQTAAYRNLLITIEMFFAAILLRFAFPYRVYMDLRKDDQGRGNGIPMTKITSNFKDTLNPHDVVDDAIHNFSRVYQKYAQQGDMSEEEAELDSTSPSHSDEDAVKKRRSPMKKRNNGKEFERVTLLVESDEDEVL